MQVSLMNEEKIVKIAQVVTEGFFDTNSYSILVSQLSQEYDITEIRASLVMSACYAYMVNNDEKVRNYMKKKIYRLLEIED